MRLDALPESFCWIAAEIEQARVHTLALTTAAKMTAARTTALEEAMRPSPAMADLLEACSALQRMMPRFEMPILPRFDEMPPMPPPERYPSKEEVRDWWAALYPPLPVLDFAWLEEEPDDDTPPPGQYL